MSSTVHSNMFPSAVDGAPPPDDHASPVASAGPASAFPAAPRLGGHAPDAAPDVAEQAELNDENLRKSGASKVERAIAYVRIAGPTSGNALASLLGIKPGNVLATLNSAIANGRLRKDGTTYTLGDGTKPTAEVAATVKEPARPRAMAKGTQTRAPAPTHSVAASLCVRDLQLVVWTSGTMTVRAADNVVELNAAQASVLRSFLQLDAGIPT